jgi:hypothetical protein
MSSLEVLQRPVPALKYGAVSGRVIKRWSWGPIGKCRTALLSRTDSLGTFRKCGDVKRNANLQVLILERYLQERNLRLHLCQLGRYTGGTEFRNPFRRIDEACNSNRVGGDDSHGPLSIPPSGRLHC